MAIKFPADITRDSIVQVCDGINKEARKIKRKLLKRRLILSIGYPVFVAISLLLCLGTIYHLCTDAEKVIVDTIPVLGMLCAAAELRMFSNDLPVAYLIGIFAAVQYLIPLAVCVIISILVGAAYRPNPAVEATEEPERAHRLSKAINDIYHDWLCVTDGSKFRIVCNYLFTLVCAGVLVLFVLKSGGFALDLSTILGAVVVFVLLHLAYKLLLGIFVGIAKWFYYCKNPINEQMRTAVNAYLLKVDPKAAKEEEQVQTSASEPAPKKEIVHIDSFTWTVDYVRANEEKCGDTAMNYVEVAKDFLRERNYSGAANSFDHAAYALELLSRVPGGEKYVPYLYANQYAASRVYAFGLSDRSAAQFRLEQAVTNAGEFALKQLDGYERAIRDFKVMNGVLEEFNNGTSLSTLKEYYGTEFPYDILE